MNYRESVILALLSAKNDREFFDFTLQMIEPLLGACVSLFSPKCDDFEVFIGLLEYMEKKHGLTELGRRCLAESRNAASGRESNLLAALRRNESN